MKIGDLFLDLNLNTKSFNSQINSISNYANNTLTRSFSSIGKMIGGVFAIGALSSFGKSCIDLGSDLAEVQNVVDVTFPNMSNQVNAFAKNAINQFGLSETIAKRMTGTYGSMAKAFGFSEKEAYDMSTTLTGLAGDVASFYNLDPSEAYTKLKSVFSGETETLKDLGVVMTQNALDQYALANGLGKTTSAMTEQEKVMLRMKFVTEQLGAASGDFARTSDSWANKVRVLSLNFQSLKASIGEGLINILSPVVSLINNIIVKLQKASQYFVAFTSLLSGKKVSTSLGSVSSNLDKSAVGAANLANNVSGVGKAAKKAAKNMGALAGFDDIKNISTSKESSDGQGDASGGGTSGLGDVFASGSDISNALDVDTSQMEAGLNKAKKLLSNFTGFLKSNKDSIISLIAGISAGFLVFKGIQFGAVLYVQVSKLVTLFSNWQLGIGATIQMLTGMTAPVMGIVAGVAAVTAALVYLYQTSDSFRSLVNEALENLLSILTNIWNSLLKPFFSFLSDVFQTVLIPLATFISKVFVKAVESVATIVLSFWNNVLSPLVNFIVDILGIALQGIIDIWNGWKPVIETLFDALNWLWDNCLSPIVDFITGVFTETFEEWGRVIDRLIPTVKAIFKGLVDFFVGVFTLDIDKAWEGIKGIFNGFSAFLQNIFNTDWTKVIGKLGVPLNAALGTIKAIWNTIKGVFNGIITFVSGVFTGNWKKAWQGVKDIFSSIIKGLTNIFKSPINAIIDGINTFIGGLNKIKIPDWVPGIGGYGFNITKIPKLAQGGYVKANSPQLAMIGDNKTQGEIVSPEGKMYEVMMSALKSFGTQNAGKEDIQVLVSILYEILEAIRNLHLVVDGDSLNDDKNKRDKERALRTGAVIY